MKFVGAGRMSSSPALHTHEPGRVDELRVEYEEDHLIALELGGGPRNPENLWPEPHSQSKLSDPLETSLKQKVCKGLMKLAKARAAIRLFKNTQG
jgi:hypothetical protein